jgi:hypothetical protein
LQWNLKRMTRPFFGGEKVQWNEGRLDDRARNLQIRGLLRHLLGRKCIEKDAIAMEWSVPFVQLCNLRVLPLVYTFFGCSLVLE